MAKKDCGAGFAVGRFTKPSARHVDICIYVFVSYIDIHRYMRYEDMNRFEPFKNDILDWG